MKLINILFLVSLFLFSCTRSNKKANDAYETDYQFGRDTLMQLTPDTQLIQDTIIDADYTFEEAMEGTLAPKDVIEMLELVEVIYLSTDGKIHKGQFVTNKSIADDIRSIFEFMLNEGFVVEKAIPMVKYGWNDSLSMDDNNSYSFCYRNISYSKHANGMAIDLNPKFNPLRYKYEDRPNEPRGAVLDTTVNGTLYPGHVVVEKFIRKGFRWGHTFSRFYDDHHFEKR